MPYTSVKELPAGTKKLSSHQKRVFMAAFNAAHKTYGGDESKAFATAYAAARKASRKRKAQASRQDGGAAAMAHRLLTGVQRIYDAYLGQHQDLPVETVAEARDLLSQVAANPESDLRKLKELEEILVPSFGDLTQHYTPAIKHENDFPGSLNAHIRKVVCAARKECDDYIGDCGFVLAVYPEYIVTCCIDGCCCYPGDDAEEADYYKIDYTMDDQGEVTFGEAEEVDVLTIVVPEDHAADETFEHEETEQADSTKMGFADERIIKEKKPPKPATSAEPDTEEKDEPKDDDAEEKSDKKKSGKKMGQATKTDNGQQFGRGAYLIVGDPKEPSTWKVRVEETPGKVTVPQLGRAYAALTKGFRGNKVDASSEQIKVALSRLRGLYKRAGAPFPGEKSEKKQSEVQSQAALPVEEYPEWLLQGDDPPGGDEALTQSYPVIVQDAKVDAKGVMHIQGIATVGNILSKKREVYPTQVWQDNMPRLERMTEQGKLLGESDHPRDHVPTLDRTCVKFTSIWMQGNEVHFQADILPTQPYGQNLITLIQSGVGIDISSRGMGKMVRGSWKNPDTGEVYQDVNVVQRGFRADGFDPVGSGASPGSMITEYHMAQSSDAEAAEEELEMGEVQELKQLLEGLAAQQKAQNEIILKLSQAKDEGITKVEAVKDETPVQQTNPLANVTLTTQRDPRTEKMLIKQVIDELVEAADLPGQWKNVYRRNLENLTVKTVEELEQVAPQVLGIITTTYDSRPQFPGQGFTVQKDKGERGPRTRAELMDALVADLPDDCPMDPVQQVIQDLETGEEKAVRLPDSIRTPRRQLRKIIENIATHQDDQWNGPAAFDALFRMEQGWGAQFVKEQWLNQSCADGTTSVGAGGAPSSALFIFPLIRRVFPQLIATELSSVQPMDRPNSKVFYLDNYRISTGVDSVDEGGNTISNRMRIDRSDSFSSSYADDPGECNQPNKIQLRLSSKSIDAQTKKLFAEVTIEETQDLRSYHGLDALTELVSATSREVALEWNQIILQELLDGATAGTRNFGTVAPSGYTQKEWDEYLVRMLEAASMDIFKKRHGTMTHVVAGPDATLKLSASYRVGIQPSGPNPNMYPGLVLNPFMAGASANVKMYTTSFWTGVNANKILVIRRGTDWSDTPHVYAPYIDYVTPPLTLPSTLTTQQAIMSRAGHKTIVGDALAVINIVTGATGVPL